MARTGSSSDPDYVRSTQGDGPSVADQPGAAVTIGAASAVVAAANTDRKALFICNDHAANVLYLRLGASAAVANQGIRLGPGACVVIRGDEYAGEVRGIASGAGTVVTISEV